MPWDDNLDAESPAYEIAASANRRIRVVAGPGAGKSFAMKRRVARLLESQTAPSEILPVTFTRVAAEDLHRELVGMGVPGCEEIEGTTLHSLAMRILMRSHVLQATGRTPRLLNVFELAPVEADLSSFGGLKEVRKRSRAYESAWARLQHDEPGFVIAEDDKQFQEALLGWLRFHEAMLIGEVIPILYSYLRDNPFADERHEFSHILVDEYQDLNKAEQSVIDLLADDADVCIVGDDDQSIYSFKHAHPDGIREWLNHNTGADDLTLEECRRCPTQVVEMANSLISRNVNRPVPRALTPRPGNGRGDVRILQYAALGDEIVGIANLVGSFIDDGISPGEILILAQRNVIGTPIYEGLVERGIPARSYYAEAELDKQEAQRRFALLKLFVNRNDRVALRWLLGFGSSNWLAGGYKRLRVHCEENGTSPWQTLESITRGELVLPHTGALVQSFRQIHQEVEGLTRLQALPAIVDYLFPEGDAAVRDIRSLSLGVLEEVDENDVDAFLSELVAAIAKPEVPSEIQDVRIMSLHKSKGLSAPVTIIAGCIDGLLPKQPEAGLPRAVQAAQIEEQRRLFYVGITRVKAIPEEGKPGTLILSYSSEMPMADAMASGISPARSRYGTAQLIASRFIAELGPAAPRPRAGRA